MCIMCNCNCESVEHLLLHSPMARELWSFARWDNLGDAKQGD